MASRRGCHAAFVLQSRLKYVLIKRPSIDRPSVSSKLSSPRINFRTIVVHGTRFLPAGTTKVAIFLCVCFGKKKEEERKWENRRKKRVEKRGGWQEWEVDEAGRRIISGDDVGTESNWRKEGPDAEQREEGRGMQNGKSIGCTERTRPRTTKIIFSLTRSRRGNHRDGMEIARGIEYSTLFFRIERAEGSLDIPSDVDPLNFLE